MTENLVEVHHLKKYFHQGRPDEVHAIDDVSFNIQRGEVFGLVGESGSGKTTTGRCILNLYQPTSGDIIYDGEDVIKLKGHQKLKEFHQKTSMIFQDPYSSLDPRMSVRDIIAEGLKIHQKITNREEFDEKVAPVRFIQDNESMSSYGVMRGLHFQTPPYSQSKLVRCVKGAVLDVAVDIRKGSPTYGQHVAVELTEENHRQFFIPRGFAHGFAVLSETAVFQYKCDNFYHPEADGGISILDTSLGIDWRIPTDKAILSDKDTKHPLLKDFDSPFNIRVPLY